MEATFAHLRHGGDGNLGRHRKVDGVRNRINGRGRIL